MQDMQPLDSQQPVSAPGMETDHEGAMAKADLYKLANYSLKLFKQINDGDQLEAWVQAKITKAADYIASVYHYLEYEMKFSEYGSKLENSDVYSESQKLEIRNKLMEAKEKIKALKVTQAEKMSEGILTGGERTCGECGGTGTVYDEPKAVPAHVKAKVDKYKRLTKATHAAHKRLDRNNNGIPDDLEDKEVGEDQGSLKKTGDSYKTAAGGTVTKTATGVKHERDPNSYTDGGDDLDTMAKSGKGIKSHAKAKSAAEKKAEAPKQKKSKSGTWGMEGGEKFDNRKKEKAVDEMFGQGVYEGKKAKKDYDGDGKVESDKDEVWGSRIKAAKKAGKMEEGKDEGKPDYIDLDKDGDKKEPMKKAAKEVKTDEGAAQQMFPQNDDGATAPPPKGKDGQYPIVTSGPNKGKRWSPTTPGPTNPVFKESEVIAESAEIARLKELTQKLLG